MYNLLDTHNCYELRPGWIVSKGEVQLFVECESLDCSRLYAADQWGEAVRDDEKIVGWVATRVVEDRHSERAALGRRVVECPCVSCSGLGQKGPPSRGEYEREEEHTMAGDWRGLSLDPCKTGRC